MPEADDFKVTIFPAPQEGAVPVLMANDEYYDADGNRQEGFDPRNAHKAIKLGYSDYLNASPAPGIIYTGWERAGLAPIDDDTPGYTFWTAFNAAVYHTPAINFVVDGMDVYHNPTRLQADKLTHKEMDQVILQGYVGKLNLWEGNSEMDDQEQLAWLDRWKQIRGLP